MSQPPISFAALAKTASNPAAGGYPYQLKGADLDKNFVFATEEFDQDDFRVSNGVSAGGHQNRKISLSKRLPVLPGTGTYVLGAVDGALQWLSTEEC